MNETSTPNYTTLIQQCLKGDRRSQKELYNQLSPSMFALCLKFFGNIADAEDALQEGFIKLFCKLNTYRHEGSFNGWARRIMMHSCIEVHRRHKKQHTDVELLCDVLPSHAPSALDNLAYKDLINATNQLSDGYRLVFNLYTQGFSHKEIGHMLNTTESTSKSQFSRAKAHLREYVQRA